MPKLSVGGAFYLRQLWLYNTGVHLVSEKKEHAYFHIWTEAEGWRGVNEVGSSLLNFFDVAEVCGSDRNLIAWSDSCSGQNKNFGLICFWQCIFLKNDSNVCNTSFRNQGTMHTYLDCDRDFGKVEVSVKRRESIYTVDDYQQIMANSQTKATVTRIGDKMVNISSLPSLLGLRKQS